MGPRGLPVRGPAQPLSCPHPPGAPPAKDGSSCAVADVESSLRVNRCRQILQGLPQHNHAVLCFLTGFLHEVSGPRGRAPSRPGFAGRCSRGMPRQTAGEPHWTGPALYLLRGPCWLVGGRRVDWLTGRGVEGGD